MTTLHVTKRESKVKYIVPETVLKEDLSKETDQELCDLHIALKAAEHTMNSERVRVEQELIKRLGLPELFRQKTHTPAGFRVVIAAEGDIKMDWPKWTEVRGTIPEAMRPTRWIETVDKSKAKYLKQAEPAMFAQIAQALTTKPLKPSVTVEPYVAAVAA
jgi:hypothetical protein